VFGIVELSPAASPFRADAPTFHPGGISDIQDDNTQSTRSTKRPAAPVCLRGIGPDPGAEPGRPRPAEPGAAARAENNFRTTAQPTSQEKRMEKARANGPSTSHGAIEGTGTKARVATSSAKHAEHAPSPPPGKVALTSILKTPKECWIRYKHHNHPKVVSWRMKKVRHTTVDATAPTKRDPALRSRSPREWTAATACRAAGPQASLRPTRATQTSPGPHESDPTSQTEVPTGGDRRHRLPCKRMVAPQASLRPSTARAGAPPTKQGTAAPMPRLDTSAATNSSCLDNAPLTKRGTTAGAEGYACAEAAMAEGRLLECDATASSVAPTKVLSLRQPNFYDVLTAESTEEDDRGTRGAANAGAKGGELELGGRARSRSRAHRFRKPDDLLGNSLAEQPSQHSRQRRVEHAGQTAANDEPRRSKASPQTTTGRLTCLSASATEFLPRQWVFARTSPRRAGAHKAAAGAETHTFAKAPRPRIDTAGAKMKNCHGKAPWTKVAATKKTCRGKEPATKQGMTAGAEGSVCAETPLAFRQPVKEAAEPSVAAPMTELSRRQHNFYDVLCEESSGEDATGARSAANARAELSEVATEGRARGRCTSADDRPRKVDNWAMGGVGTACARVSPYALRCLLARAARRESDRCNIHRKGLDGDGGAIKVGRAHQVQSAPCRFLLSNRL